MERIVVKCKNNPEWKFVAYLGKVCETKFIVWSKLDERRRVEFHFPKETHFFEKAE